LGGQYHAGAERERPLIRLRLFPGLVMRVARPLDGRLPAATNGHPSVDMIIARARPALCAGGERDGREQSSLSVWCERMPAISYRIQHLSNTSRIRYAIS
jgi:hypothetical protein